MTTDEQITELGQEWYSLITGDHHKDRDCHFYIEKKWSYGQGPFYSACHDGYVADHFSVEFSSSTEAHTYLLAKLRGMIAEEKERQLDD